MLLDVGRVTGVLEDDETGIQESSKTLGRRQRDWIVTAVGHQRPYGERP